MTHAPQPFFSIIIPTYNRAKYLLSALQSILTQTFQDFEIIIVDDGSTDNTKESIHQILTGNANVYYYHKINEERSIARNYGISKASGSYISFLDSDDTLYSNHLKTAFELLNRNHFPEIGHLGFEIIDEYGKVLITRDNFDATFKEKLIHENILHGNAIFIRRDVAQKVTFIPSKHAILSEDWYVWLRLASRYKFYFDNTVTSSVVHHKSRSLLNINSLSLIKNTDLLVAYLSKDKEFLREYRGKVRYHFANHYTFLTLILSLEKRRVQTLKYLLKAIKYDVTVVFRRRFLASIKYLFFNNKTS
jgi:glycosyltransferase involved in cell wall biosynthesis